MLIILLFCWTVPHADNSVVLLGCSTNFVMRVRQQFSYNHAQFFSYLLMIPFLRVIQRFDEKVKRNHAEKLILNQNKMNYLSLSLHPVAERQTVCKEHLQTMTQATTVRTVADIWFYLALVTKKLLSTLPHPFHYPRGNFLPNLPVGFSISTAQDFLLFIIWLQHSSCFFPFFLQSFLRVFVWFCNIFLGGVIKRISE